MADRSLGPTSAERLLSIDVVKGVAILAVVVTHSFKPIPLQASLPAFHVWLAVPVFIVLAGYNSYSSFGRARGDSLSDVLTREYLRRRFLRLLVPFAVIWIMLYLVGSSRGSLLIARSTLLLRLPYGAPGNYFVPVLLALVLLAPALYVAYRRWPTLTLALAIAADLAFQFISEATGFTGEFIYSVAFLRYFAVFALGYWLADERVSDTERRWALIAGGAFSFAYTVAAVMGVAVPFAMRWGNANVLSAFLPVVVVWAALTFMPSQSSRAVPNALAFIGRSSYHIFLFQMLYFTMVGQGKPQILLVNLFVAVVGGIGFAFVEEQIRTGMRLMLAGDGI